MGFVTEITENKKTTEGSTYYDFKVAQQLAQKNADGIRLRKSIQRRCLEL